MSQNKKPLISVILPVYNNSPMLDELHQRLTFVFRKMNHPYEMIFVDDCSPDDSIRILQRLTQRDPLVIALRLAHNVGQQKATIQGLKQALGKIIVMMDADLQDPPEAIPLLINKFKEGFDVVFAGRAGRYESWHRLLFSRLYKWLIHILTTCPPDAGYFLVMKTEIARNLIELPGKNVHIVARIGLLKPRMISIPVIRKKRPSGRSAVRSKDRLELGFQAISWLIRNRLGIPPCNEIIEFDPAIESYFGKRKELHEYHN